MEDNDYHKHGMKLNCDIKSINQDQCTGSRGKFNDMRILDPEFPVTVSIATYVLNRVVVPYDASTGYGELGARKVLIVSSSRAFDAESICGTIRALGGNMGQSVISVTNKVCAKQAKIFQDAAVICADYWTLKKLVNRDEYYQNNPIGPELKMNKFKDVIFTFDGEANSVGNNEKMKELLKLIGVGYRRKDQTVTCWCNLSGKSYNCRYRGYIQYSKYTKNMPNLNRNDEFQKYKSDPFLWGPYIIVRGKTKISLIDFNYCEWKE